MIWGLSLDYVPRMTGATISWHRTNKSASVDLSYSPKDGEADRTTQVWTMRGIDGEEALNADARRLLRWGIPKALAFFDTVTNVRDLGALFEGKVRDKTSNWLYANLTYAPLAYA